MYGSMTSPFLGSSIIILAVILFMPGAFLIFKKPISFLISFGVSSFIGKIFCGNMVISSYTSWSG
jgi:hypothetical protein